MVKYLVTGGAGFIGSHLAEELVRQGETVRVLDNLSTGAVENFADFRNGIEFVQADLQDPQAVRNALRGIEVVFHQAALASVPRSVANPVETHEACVTGTVVLLDEARKAGVRRVVYAASSSAYGNSPIMPKQEGQHLEPASPYAAAKLAGELYMEAFARCYDIETVRLRYFNVFGPRQDPNSPYSAVIPLFVAALLKGERPKIFGDGEQSRDFTFIANVVRLNMLAASRPGVNGNVYNAACGSSITLIDLLQEICKLLGKPYDPEFCTPRAGDVKHSWADISAAERDLGYEVATDWREGLRRTVEWYVNRCKR